MTKSESFQWSLFARRAGVHIDFHAHRHFDNLWGFPGHFDSPKFGATRRAVTEPRTAIDTAQVRHIAQRTGLSADTSLLSKAISFLDKA
jgi:hypothetical protein